MTNKTTFTTPHWKIRRLASRALRVLERHQDKSPAIASYGLTLRPAAEAYIDIADRHRASGARRQTEYQEGKAAVETLSRAVRAWAGQISALKKLKGFEAAGFANRPNVPDDVISDAEVLLEMVAAHVAVNADDVPFLDVLTEDLQAKLAEANKEWLEAETERTSHQVLTEEHKALGRTLLDQLIPFRRALGVELGTHHPDFRALRTARIRRELPEDPTLNFPQDEADELADEQELSSSPDASRADADASEEVNNDAA